MNLALLLLLFSSRVLRAQSLTVSQPDKASTHEGGAVILECVYESTSNSSIGRYTWYYHNSSSWATVSNETGHHSGRVAAIDKATFHTSRKASIQLRSVLPGDAGLYVCEVEIFNVSQGRGNGTLLRVLDAVLSNGMKETSNDEINHSEIILWSRTIVVPLLFIFSVVLINRYYANK
ncbi:natural cytotoxicity triggering receptor 3 [Pleurodeles waltl]|uniref:natural cytotoxicity triggering receptor 3 n=1 Tax=Pleurodeles waltl TaxID=8319 RepID=UPI0037097FC0